MLHVEFIKAFQDNYIWLIKNNNNECVIVDPGSSSPVIEYLKNRELILKKILITHHHHDHIGGVRELQEIFRDIEIITPHNINLPNVTRHVSDGDVISIFNHTFEVMELPGHTKEHIGFFGDKKLFCGDVLFSGGCGRVFTKKYDDMFESLIKIKSLPNDTLIFCAHEYTENNLKFALHTEPKNQNLIQYNQAVLDMRKKNIPTIPVILSDEKKVNPFLRCDILSKNNLGNLSEFDFFIKLRKEKDSF